MNNSLKQTVKHAAQIGLLALITVGSLQLGNLTTPETAHAATFTTLASSSLAENNAIHVALRDYRGLGVWNTNWPTRSPGCPPNSTGYKTVPWQPSDIYVGHSDTGDNFVASGNCADRYVDAGSSTGAWASPGLWGGWTGGSGSGGFGSSYTGASANLSCNLTGGATPMIWGSPGADLGDQASGPGGLMGQNNYSTVPGPNGLYSNGTSFFRNNFYVADPASLSNINMFVQADDWMNVYLNGTNIITTTWTSAGGFYSIPASAFVAGNNILAIQVTDKAVWASSDNAAARGSGICYNVTADVAPDACLNISGYQSTIPPGLALDSSGNCVPVYKPVVIGNGSDIHAGSGVCGLATNAGSVIGQGDSKGEYVVTAQGGISNFGSNGTGTSSDASIASYQPITLCRPDLVTVANTFITRYPTEVIARTGGPFYTVTLDSLNAADLLTPKGVIYVTGDVIISGGTGIVGRKLTIYATGTITINSSIRLVSGSVARADQPSLGLIAGGDIKIAGAATQVDAYMFSNGNINTCYTAPCDTTLNVRGFLMAKTLQLRRQGPPN